MLILFLFVILMAGSDAANITATGGGIVKLGEDLVNDMYFQKIIEHI
jgi:hypothetical protein